MVVLDKTGTITRGRPEVTDVLTFDQNITENELLRLAASVERGSEHPLGEAIIAEAGNRSLDLSEPEGFTAVPGKGVRSVVDSSNIMVGTKNYLEENVSTISNLSFLLLHFKFFNGLARHNLFNKDLELKSKFRSGL